MSDEERIARVARALCVAEGHDPEVMIDVGDETVDIDGGATWHREVAAPAWTTYAGEARRFIAAAKAAGMLE